ncbi:amidohydrolase family protein [Pseudooceanicola sp.]|uniref:amidohydrolase family protein n=1 Tax=Pseudooceanicola sp. TaxID=1914328 RepID=UPI0026380EEF|nr:amidohydrolase family protein [Pseudooceanicola sp.]MDF1856301.1 amidohydrolase family protein [Pseudooceanicola sp.]
MTKRDSVVNHPLRADWLNSLHEDIIEPDLPIIDPHHHLWERLDGYLLDDITADVQSGHNVVATMFVQCRYAMHEDGPEVMRPLGETEAVMAIAEAAAARGGPTNYCAGIVGFADLGFGAAVAEILEAHKVAAKGRFRGIRHITAHEPSFDSHLQPVAPDLMASPEFRAGFACLAPAGLSFDGWLYHTQIPQFTDLAWAFPETTMILDHVGGPLGIGAYRGKGDAVFADWKAAMTDLATCPNVSVKLGGLGMEITGCTWAAQEKPPGSQALADSFRPWIDTVIDLFGAERCMFESNFPVDKASCSYPVLWNAFKRLAAGASATEKRDLFHDTAKRVYALPAAV